MAIFQQTYPTPAVIMRHDWHLRACFVAGAIATTDVAVVVAHAVAPLLVFSLLLLVVVLLLLLLLPLVPALPLLFLLL